ncbi:MAG: TerB family tellurite resistance protein [Planctomycetota bacterium]|nr:TerB family tellurite resistance protein [Planctomycetota bacterium]
MDKQQTVDYLVNVYAVLAADGEVERSETKAFEVVAKEIGAGFFERKKAIEAYEVSQATATLNGRWSEKVRNLEDMLFVAYCNGVLAPDEKEIIVTQARVLGLEKEQLAVIKTEAKQRFEAFR